MIGNILKVNLLGTTKRVDSRRRKLNRFFSGHRVAYLIVFFAGPHFPGHWTGINAQTRE